MESTFISEIHIHRNGRNHSVPFAQIGSALVPKIAQSVPHWMGDSNRNHKPVHHKLL